VPEMLLEHFNRWLSSPNAQLHNAELTSLLQNMMGKVFVQLISDLQKLGSEIIYANLDKIVIHTSKNDVKKAGAYIAYVIDSILKKPIYQLLSISPIRFYQNLFWLDHKNYGSFSIDVESLSEDRIELTEFTEWNVCRYLPPRVQACFDQQFSEFLTVVHTVFSNKSELSTADCDLKVIEYLSHELKRSLIKIVPSLQSEWRKYQLQPVEGDDSFVSPQLPGSKDLKTSPVLELIKILMEVLFLYKPAENEIRSLRRDLLSVIGYKEFDKITVFDHHTSSLVLPHVICEYCSSAHDIDFMNVSMIYEEGTEASKRRAIRCQTCKSEYNVLELEQRMIEILSSKVIAWQKQDLKCDKCRMVTSMNLREHCTCSRALKNEMNVSEMKREMEMNGNVAKYYGMRLLQEMAEMMLVSL
jgi:DNA polymerase epsilon subunit 1